MLAITSSSWLRLSEERFTAQAFVPYVASKSATYGQSIPVISGPDHVGNNGADDLKTFGLFAVYLWEAPTRTERRKGHKINILDEPMTLNQRVLGSSPKKKCVHHFMPATTDICSGTSDPACCP